MSLEVFGDEGDGFDAEQLYAHGWESDADCKKWWRSGEPDTVYSFQEACQIYEEHRDADIEDMAAEGL